MPCTHYIHTDTFALMGTKYLSEGQGRNLGQPPSWREQEGQARWKGYSFSTCLNSEPRKQVSQQTDKCNVKISITGRDHVPSYSLQRPPGPRRSQDRLGCSKRTEIKSQGPQVRDGDPGPARGRHLLWTMEHRLFLK